MPSAKTMLFVVLGIFVTIYLVGWISVERKRQHAATDTKPEPKGLLIGFITNFFDTLGIGSFATTTTAFHHLRLVDDRVIPGTLNVGHTLPTIVQAFIYIAIIQVDMTTLVALISAAVLGSWLGAGVVSGFSRVKVQAGMGGCLLVLSVVMLLRALNVVPGGEALGLTGPLLLIGITGNFILGALMTLGLGLYAPCLVMIALLGMSPTTAFPIMMGSCAFLMPIGSLRFVKSGAYNLRAAIGLAIGGIPAVLLAAYVVKSLPPRMVAWLVVFVVLYAAITMLRAAIKERALVAPGQPPVTAH
jgi:uncharacterized membrane protein YfcA